MQAAIIKNMAANSLVGARFVGALGLMTLFSVGLLVVGAVQNGELLHGYLAWNLFLAWIPFGLALWLARTLRRKLWSSWEALLVSVAWVGFLPNSFYMVSDFIHLVDIQPAYVLYGAVTFTSFILTGLMLGMASVYIVHVEFLKRVSPLGAAGLVAALLLLSSGAIYIGRDLRWNTWDVLLSPLGLLFDVSERLLHPSQYPQVLAVVLPFFILLSGLYFVVWQFVGASASPRTR